jgi:hypothetical protein
MVQREDTMEKIVPQREDSGMNKPERMAAVLLSSCYLAPVEYYSALFRAEKGIIEIHDNYQKQSYRNRCNIAGANGVLSLTIPVVKPTQTQCKMKDIRIADHGNWQHLHWNAIVSAYNSTPFFRYYEEDFRPFFTKRFDFLHDFNEGLRQLICRLTGIETAVVYTTEYNETIAPGLYDLREAIHPKKKPDWVTPVYYQVFSSKNGFIPNLSILDLLCNMGNESRLFLI